MINLKELKKIIIILKIAIEINKVEAEIWSCTPYKKERNHYSLEYKNKIVQENLENKNTSINDLEEKYDIPKSSIN